MTSKPLNPDELLQRMVLGAPNQCLRDAVHLAYRVPLSELPAPPPGDPDGFWDQWEAWAQGRGLHWWRSAVAAPSSLERWIAVVPGLCDSGTNHAVVMGGGSFLLDPNSLVGTKARHCYGGVALSMVSMALALVPVDFASEVHGEIAIGGWGLDEEPPVPSNVSSRDLRYVLAGSQWQDSDTSKDLIVRAASFGVSGLSGTLTTATNETQTLSPAGSPASGTWIYNLDGQASVAIDFDATDAEIEAALEAMPNIGTGNVSCTGGPIHTTNVTIEFIGDLAGCNMNLGTITDSVNFGSITCAAGVTGVPGYVSAALYDEWTAICDSGAIGLTGSYRLIAVVYDNSSTSDVGAVTLRLAKGIGDAQVVDTNTYRTIAAVGDYSIVDFGPVSIPAVPSGTQQWKVRVDGKSSGTAGSTCRIVDLLFFPNSMTDAEVRAVNDSGSVLSMLDNFGATSGVLTGDTSTSGHTWAAMGALDDADDFTETAAPDNSVIRTAVSDTNTDIRYGRGVVLGSATPTDVSVSVDIQTTGGTFLYMGVIARLTDNDNFIAATKYSHGGVFVYKVKAGSVSVISSTSIPDVFSSQGVSFTVRASGTWMLAVDGIVVASGVDSDFATGGALASGKSGIIDWSPNSTAATRTYSNFRVSIPAAEPVAIHDGQSLDFRPDGSVWREVAAGSIYTQPQTQTVAVPPKLGPYGDDGIANRLMVAAGRFNPDQASQPYFDPFTVKVYTTPVYEVGATDD